MYSSADTIWIALSVILIFMMQAGFAMVETGFTRIRNCGNVAMKNLSDFVIGSLVFFTIGISLMDNTSLGGIVGIPSLFAGGLSSADMPKGLYIMSRVVFCGTAATIASGAMSERTKFKSYLIYSAFISGLVYPISAHWIWNGAGWLAKLGFHDFAGGCAVHLVGGMTALAGTMVLGPRIGKYNEKGESQAIPGQDIPFGALGVFLLWFGWYGFNAGSTHSVTGDAAITAVGNIILNTTLSAAMACATALFLSWKRYGKSDITITLNGALAGLVAITSGCDQVNALGSLVTGFCAGTCLVLCVELLDVRCRIDDPVGAVSVHGICGALGVIMTGFFSQEKGLFYTGKADFLGVQLLGACVTAAWAFGVMFAFFQLLKATVGFRVSAEEEERGLDEFEHALMNSYEGEIEFMAEKAEPASAGIMSSEKEWTEKPSENAGEDVADGRLHKVVVVMNPNRLDKLLAALDEIDITGMTVTNVSGCGIQKGHKHYYRGSEVARHLLMKVKVEIVISTVPVSLLVRQIKKAVYTGNIGDGKIFIYDVENVIKIRTGEEGVMALE